MNILAVIHPAIGPLNSTFYLSRLLKNRNHRLIYLLPITDSKLEQLITHQGFETIFFNNTDLNEEFINSLIINYQINSVILDGDQLRFAILFYKFKVSKIFVNICIQTDKSPYIPPFFSNIIPSRSLTSYLLIEFTWLKHFLIQKVLYLKNKLAKRDEDFHDKKLAKAVGFPLRKYARYDRAWLYRLTVYPEFFLYPVEFDFPRSYLPKNQFIIGPMLDIERKGTVFDWRIIQNSNPVVYCALGTLAHAYYANYLSFLQKVISVFEKNAKINLIMSVGEHVDIEDLSVKKTNIYLFNKVPQMEILKRSTIMITHGGINSIKECIYFAVPMLVYPVGLFTDQQGNAARVAYHKLGKMCSITDSAVKIESDIGKVLSKNIYRENVSRMQSIFNNYKVNENHIVDLIESHLY